MECPNCKKKAPSYYSPKELYKFKLLLCKKCLELLKNEDLRYIQNTEEVMKLIKRKENKNGIY